MLNKYLFNAVAGRWVNIKQRFNLITFINSFNFVIMELGLFKHMYIICITYIYYVEHVTVNVVAKL